MHLGSCPRRGFAPLGAIISTVSVAIMRNMRAVERRSSVAIRRVYVSVKDACATVVFTDGSTYDYKGVSRRAIINLLVNKSLSLGFWVNRNCDNPERNVTYTQWVKYAV